MEDKWRPRPVIYEIPTWAWLAELGARQGSPLTLGQVPGEVWDALAGLGIEAVWLMGVWERSPAGLAIARTQRHLKDELRAALPGMTPEDNVGSAYCVRDYRVDARLGGDEGLAQARAELARRGLWLILDFVPNHVAPDHPWVTSHPEYFIHGTAEERERVPQAYVETGGQILAAGRDPHLPPWQDVLQLNAFEPGQRAAAIETALSVAARCDGMRCDMAMLLANEVFAETWGAAAGPVPPTEYWEELIPRVKAQYPNCLFVAEVYWGLEAAMLEQGFDYAYDKPLYDLLRLGDAEGARARLEAEAGYRDRLVHFVENHDEARAAAVFAPAQARVAAVASLTLPGARLVHDGQLEGRKLRLPVFLARRAAETRDYELQLFYRKLLTETHAALYHEGEWTLCARHGWSDNPTSESILAWTWRRGADRALIVVNLAGHRSQSMIRLPWDDLRGRVWRLADTLNGDVFLREGSQLTDSGLYVDLDAWRFHFLTFE